MMELRQIEREIETLQKDMNLSFRRTVEDAVRIGGLLKNAKALVSHGDFIPWCERQGLKPRNCEYYMKLDTYKSKIANFANLDEAYKLIESEENRRKRAEFEEQGARIKEFKKTGKKPEGWDETTDAYRMRKEQEDDAYEERKRKMFEERERKAASEPHINTKKLLDDLAKNLNEMDKITKVKDEFLSKFRLSGNNANEPIYAALLEYLLTKSESERLEACHNIIKFCKGLASELQRKSIKVVS